MTYAEILQQPDLWPLTAQTVQPRELPANIVVSGAGTSAYAAGAIARGVLGAKAVPSTDLLLDPAAYLTGDELLISVARSGDSPESVGTIDRVQRLFPRVKHLAITCNADGLLARRSGVESIVLDPRTNDRGLAMTSSFSNLVLGGLCLSRHASISSSLATICDKARSSFPGFEAQTKRFATVCKSRALLLASPPLFPIACEASLKILELTAGQIVAVPETFLGLRHGPMSFLRPPTPVLCFLSGDRRFLRYELDVLSELRQKQLGVIAVVSPRTVPQELYDEFIPSLAPEDMPDVLRAPFDIVSAQLLAYHLSLQLGLNPDNPSPAGVIHRVVEGVRLYED